MYNSISSSIGYAFMCQLTVLNMPIDLFSYFCMVNVCFFYICDCTELKRQDGCVLTNPPNTNAFASWLHILGGFFNVITYKITDFNSYHLRFYFWKSINKCGTGTQGVAFGGFVKTHPSRRFCSMRSHIMIIRFLSSIGYDFICHL